MFWGQINGQNRLAKVWRNGSYKAGIKGIKLYEGTRHSFASQLINKGVPLKTIGEILGHSNSKVTDKYAHVCIYSMRDAMER